MAADGQGELFGKPYLRRHRRLQPLLQIARIESPDGLPVRASFFRFSQAVLPGQLRGVTKTKLLFARSAGSTDFNRAV